jgi:putative PIN family toxin of toxin-antitoxin system
MHAVLDTNVFVSMLMGGRVGQINDAWREGKFTLVVSDEIVSEYLDVLQRPKFRLSPQLILFVMGRVQRKAQFVLPTERITAVIADPTDNKFLEAALAGQADCVVTGDKHLLPLHPFRDISILKAHQFIEQLSSI